MVANTENVGHAHRPGLFKLPNKKHKTGQHRSKREISRENKGNLGVRTHALKKSKKVNKAQRKNQLRQLWAQKQQQLLEKMRIQGPFNQRAPFLVTIISLDEKRNVNEIIRQFEAADPDSSLSRSEWGRTSLLTVPRLKARFAFVCPDVSDITEVLDCVRVSEILLIIWPLDEAVSQSRAQLLTTIMAQGLPVPLHLVVGLPANGKHRDQMRKVLENSMAKWPSLRDDKTHGLDSPGDAQKVLRHIASVQKKPSILQQRHSHILAEQVHFVPEDTKIGFCTLVVSGFLRGAPLDVNKLVHVQGYGDFNLVRVDYHKNEATTVSIVPKENSTCTSENLDDMEIDNKSLANTNDGEDEFDTDIDEEESEAEEDESEEHDIDNNDEDETMSFTADNLSTAAETKVDTEEVLRFREERENAKWPDEVETERNMPARERFIKYRGLKSFRTSPWDAKENLPRDYAKIYKFSDFKKTKKNVLMELRKSFMTFPSIKEKRTNLTKEQREMQIDATNEKEEQLVYPGSYVTLHIADVPITVKEELSADKPLVIFGLLMHEEKMSVLNIVLEKHPLCRLPLKNRDPLVFQVGYRRFEAAPLFSQHNNGNKFKMERFAPTEGTFCASVLAPIAIPPATVLVFRRDARNHLRVVASGNVLDLNPDRIVLKRIVLSGHPFKVSKRLAVVRYMFYNKEDVEWFKPIEVYTAKGRRGHIKESLGTHGLMKCLFDQPLSTQDSVFMNMYKRVFPKWSYTPRVPLPMSSNENIGGDECTIEMDE